MNRINKNKGFLVVEVLVATSIIAASILAATAVAQKSIYVSRQAFHTTQAGFLLEEGAESVRIIRDNAWTNISTLEIGTNYYTTFSGGTWILSTTPNEVDIFTRTVIVANVNRDNATQDISVSGTIDPDAKLVTIIVSWTEGGVVISKNLQFYIINIF